MTTRIDSKLKQRLAWWTWKLRHPGKSFEDFYVDRVERGLRSGGAHRTLGSKHSDPEWFEDSARRQLAFLTGRGLRPDQRVLDYGCGSLRLGRVLVDFLDRGGYRGADVTDTFFRAGLEELPSGWQARHAVQLDVFRTGLVDELRSWGPDFIVSVAVLMHIPPQELDRYLRSLLGAALPATEILTTFKETDRTEARTAVTWGYRGDELLERVERAGGRAEILRDPENEQALGYEDGDYRVLCIRHAT